MLDFEFFLFAPIKQIQLNQRTNEKNIKLTEVFVRRLISKVSLQYSLFLKAGNAGNKSKQTKNRWFSLG